jgi:hypothetical protein
MRARRPAKFPIAKRRRIALICKPLRDRTPDKSDRALSVVAIVSVALPRDRDVRRMVRIVVPLRPKPSFEQRCFVRIVLQHEMHRPIDARIDGRRQLAQEMPIIAIVNRMHGIESQPIETIFEQPIQRVLDEIRTHRIPIAGLDIDRSTPRRLVTLRVKLRRIRVKVVPLRTKVVVHHIEIHGKSTRMRRRNERLELVRRPVVVRRRIRQHAVVSPIPRPRDVRDRHKFERRHAK